MPKFVSSTSGRIYANNKLVKAKDDEEDDIASLIEAGNSSDLSKKPSAINKKGTKEKQKNSLELFKEELKRLQSERDEKRNKMKYNINQNLPSVTPEKHLSQPLIMPPVPFPILADPRCPPPPLLQINSGYFGGPFINDYDPSIVAPNTFYPANMQFHVINHHNDQNLESTRHKPRVCPKSTDPQERQVQDEEPARSKRSLSEAKKEWLADIMRSLDPTKVKIGSAMMFCINHSDAAQEIIDTIHNSIQLLDIPFQKKVAQVYLISDILHNCSAAVTNASYYRKGFQAKLVSIFEHLRSYLVSIEDEHKANKFKQKTFAVLGAWKEWNLYEDEFVIQLSNVLLGLQRQKGSCEIDSSVDESSSIKSSENDIDGIELDDEALSRCLEAKGLSVRWYRTLELSEDEETVDNESAQA